MFLEEIELSSEILYQPSDRVRTGLNHENMAARLPTSSKSMESAGWKCQLVLQIV